MPLDKKIEENFNNETLRDFWNNFSKKFNLNTEPDFSKNPKNNFEFNEFLEFHLKQLVELYKNYSLSQNMKINLNKLINKIDDLLAQNISRFSIAHSDNFQEISNLLSVISRDLKESQIEMDKKDYIINFLDEKSEIINDLINNKTTKNTKKINLEKLKTGVEKIRKYLEDLNNKVITLDNLDKKTEEDLFSVLRFIIDEHPYMSSLKQPICDKEGKIIKYEFLVGDDLFKDDFLSKAIGMNKGIFIEMLNSPFMNTVNIDFSITHLKAHFYDITSNIEKYKKEGHIPKASINISEAELKEELGAGEVKNNKFIEMVGMINSQLLEYNLTIKDIISFEFLEYSIDFSDPIIQKNLLYLKEKFGIEIGLDDFGIGDSNLDRLYEIEEIENEKDIEIIDFIKLDMGLISSFVVKEIYEKDNKANVFDLIGHIVNIIAMHQEYNDTQKIELKQKLMFLKKDELTKMIKLNKPIGIEVFNDLSKFVEEEFELGISIESMIGDNIEKSNKLIRFMKNNNKYKTLIFEYIESEISLEIMHKEFKDYDMKNLYFQGYYFKNKFKNKQFPSINHLETKNNLKSLDRRNVKKEGQFKRRLNDNNNI